MVGGPCINSPKGDRKALYMPKKYVKVVTPVYYVGITDKPPAADEGGSFDSGTADWHPDHFASFVSEGDERELSEAFAELAVVLS